MNSGVYCLIIRLGKSQRIKIGKLGSIAFENGFYCYVGSALNNLEKRIERHERKKKKLRWHIDYFLQKGEIIGIKRTITKRKMECALSKKIGGISDGKVSRFGSSDCNCSSHLYYFKRNPIRQILQLNP